MTMNELIAVHSVWHDLWLVLQSLVIIGFAVPKKWWMHSLAFVLFLSGVTSLPGIYYGLARSDTTMLIYHTVWVLVGCGGVLLFVNRKRIDLEGTAIRWWIRLKAERVVRKNIGVGKQFRTSIDGGPVRSGTITSVDHRVGVAIATMEDGSEVSIDTRWLRKMLESTRLDQDPS